MQTWEYLYAYELADEICRINGEVTPDKVVSMFLREKGDEG